MTSLPKPLWEGGGVVLFHAEAEELTPRFEERGCAMFDPPYSKHVHSKSRAGARTEPLKSGNGKIGKAAISRAVDFGFEHLSPKFRRFLARESARLGKRWTLVFCDVESAWLWRLSLLAAGLDVKRTCHWRKLACTPQFTGDRPAVGCEAIVSAHAHNGVPHVDFDIRTIERLARATIKGAARKKDVEMLAKFVLMDLQRRHPFCPECEPNDMEAIICAHPYPGRGQEKLAWNGGGKRGVYEHAVVVERFGGETRINETQKPEGLMVELIEDFTNEGELVYDFTCGGGTTGVAAMRKKRRCVMIEKRKDQAERTAERLEAEAMGLSVQAKRTGQLGLFGTAATISIPPPATTQPTSEAVA